MAGLEELRKKLTPLFDAEKGFSTGSTLDLDPCDSYTLSDSGTVNLLSRSYGVYNINELGLQKCTTLAVDDSSEKTYRCGSHEMRVFGAIGSGASSVVQRAIHIPTHRILALKKINIFEKCATFVGTVTYMSPERIRNENYSYPADIWSLGLAFFECGTGEFPYTANEGPVNLMLQILDDPSPTPSKHKFSPEFCSFIEACLQKDADARPTAEQLLSHPFITKYEDSQVDLAVFVRSVFDPTQRMKDLADMLTIHFYLLFDGPDELWQHTRTLYSEDSVFSFLGKQLVGPNDIFASLSSVRSTLAGDWPPERLVHVVEKLQCRAHGQDGVAIRVSGSFIVGNQFLICGDGVQVEGLPSIKDLSIDISSKRMGTFREQFIMEPSNIIGRYSISKQELYIMQ